MENCAQVHVPVGIPLMTDAALIRTLFDFKQQLALVSSGALHMPEDLRSRITQAIDEIENELRDREISPEDLDPGSAASFTRPNIVRYVSLDGED